MPGTPSRHAVRRLALVVGVVIATVLSGCSTGTPSAAPVTLRLQVGLTPEELATYQPAITALDAAHPEWVIALENVPQASESREGHQPARRRRPARPAPPSGFERPALDPARGVRRPDRPDHGGRAGPRRLLRRAPRPVPLARRPVGPPRQRLAGDRLLRSRSVRGRRHRAADRHLDVDDMRTAAIALTVDAAGRHPGDAGFDPATIARWGWNGGVTYSGRTP